MIFCPALFTGMYQMLKKISLLVLSAGTLLAHASPELLQNGDFQQGLKFWSVRNPNGVSVVKNASPGGKNALKAVTAKEHYAINYTFQGKQLKPDTDYTLHGWIKTEGSAQVYLYFTTLPVVNRVQRSARSRVFRKTSDWTEVHVLLNSGKAKSMPVLTRVIGTGTAWFADLSVKEGNHLPQINLIANSDFKTQTRYREVPDCWTPNIHTGAAEPENYIFKISREKPPVPDAGVLEVSRAQIFPQLIQAPEPQLPHTYSFYAKNAVPGKNALLAVRFGFHTYHPKKFYLTDQWKRYSFTSDLKTGNPSLCVFSPDNGHFLYSAPQLILGKTPQPWQAPDSRSAIRQVTENREAVAEAVSRRISGTPAEESWNKVPAYPIRHISRGNSKGVIESHVKIQHSKEYIFIRFTGRKDPAIAPGNRSKLDWLNISDTFELFITDTALDGTYLQYAVNENGHSYSGRSKEIEMLEITSKVTQKSDRWIADVKVPLNMFHANRNWKIAFGRCYDHKVYRRTALDWSMPGSRHNTAKFGLLKGVSVKALPSPELAKLYGSIDGKELHFEFKNFKKEMFPGKLEAVIFRNDQRFWKHEQLLNAPCGKIVLPQNYHKMMDSETRIRLTVSQKNGQNCFQGSRVLYLLFSSFARHDPAMFVYPKYNFFTERDRTIDLFVTLDKKQYDNLRISILGKNGRQVFQQITSGNVSIPADKIPFGDFKIKVEALKNGRTADIRCYESFRKQPFRPEMIRVNRLTGCLASAEKQLLPMLYYPGPNNRYAFDPDRDSGMERLFKGALKANFSGVKTTFSLRDPAKDDQWLQIAAKQGAYFLADLEPLYPPGFYGRLSENMTGAEAEKIMIGYTGKMLKHCFGKPGILSYAPYHEPGYYRKGKGIVDSYRVAKILSELRKEDPYRPLTGFWAPPHWDANGEPFGSVDGVDYFITDVYSRNLKKHCDELFRISKASRIVRRPIGQIFNIDNQGSDERECPTPAEYKAEVYAALAAGYRVFFPYIGVAPVRETWQEMLRINCQLPVIAEYICHDSCRELASINEENVCYAVYLRGKELIIIASSKENTAGSRLSVNVKGATGISNVCGKELFSSEKVHIRNGIFEYLLPPAGSGIWVFQLPEAK